MNYKQFFAESLEHFHGKTYYEECGHTCQCRCKGPHGSRTLPGTCPGCMMGLKRVVEAVEDRIFYHVTADKNTLLSGKHGERNYENYLYDQPHGFHIWDNMPDAEYTLRSFKEQGKNAEIITVKIPPDVEIKADKGAIGCAYYTDTFNPGWIVPSA